MYKFHKIRDRIQYTLEVVNTLTHTIGINLNKFLKEADLSLECVFFLLHVLARISPFDQYPFFFVHAKDWT